MYLKVDTYLLQHIDLGNRQMMICCVFFCISSMSLEGAQNSYFILTYLSGLRNRKYKNVAKKIRFFFTANVSS